MTKANTSKNKTDVQITLDIIVGKLTSANVNDPIIKEVIGLVTQLETQVHANMAVAQQYENDIDGFKQTVETMKAEMDQFIAASKPHLAEGSGSLEVFSQMVTEGPKESKTETPAEEVVEVGPSEVVEGVSAIEEAIEGISKRLLKRRQLIDSEIEEVAA